MGTGYNFGEVTVASSATSTVSKSFSSTAIAAGNTLWFSSEFAMSGLSSTGTADVHVRLVNSTITLTPPPGTGSALETGDLYNVIVNGKLQQAVVTARWDDNESHGHDLVFRVDERKATVDLVAADYASGSYLLTLAGLTPVG